MAEALLRREWQEPWPIDIGFMLGLYRFHIGHIGII